MQIGQGPNDDPRSESASPANQSAKKAKIGNQERIVRPDDTGAPKSIGQVIKNIFSSIGSLFPTYEISTIAQPLRKKLQEQLPELLTEKSGIRLSFVSGQSKEDDQYLRQNVQEMQFCWSHDILEFANKKGNIILRYFDPNTSSVVMEKLQFNVKNALSLNELTAEAVKVISQKHKKNKEDILTELQSKTQSLHTQFDLPITLDKNDPLFSNIEAMQKGVLLVADNGTLTLHRTNFEPEDITFTDFNRFGMITPCSVLVNSTQMIKDQVRDIAIKQDNQLFNSFNFAQVNDLTLNVMHSDVPEKAKNMLKQKLHNQQLPPESVFSVTVDKENLNALSEPKFCIFYSFLGTTYEDKVPITTPADLQQKLKEINIRLKSANAEVTEIVEKARATCGDGVKITYSGSQIEIQYKNAVGNFFTHFADVHATIDNIQDLPDILEKTITQAKAMADMYEAIQIIQNETPGLAVVNFTSQLYLSKSNMNVILEDMPKSLKFIVFADDTRLTYLTHTVTLDPQHTVDEHKLIIQAAIEKAQKLPEEKRLKLEEQKKQAKETVNEVSQDEELGQKIFYTTALAPSFDSRRPIQVKPSKDYSHFTVRIKDPYSASGVWKKNTVGTEAGIGLGDGQLLDILEEANERLKTIQAVNTTSVSIRNSLQEAFNTTFHNTPAKSSLTAGQRLDWLKEKNSTIGFTQNGALLTIFSLDSSSPTGISETTINLLDYSPDAALELTKQHIRDIRTRMEITEKTSVTKTAKQIVSHATLPSGNTEGVKLDELQDMWKSINFSDSSNPLYVNPHSIDDGGRPITSNEAKAGLNEFISRISTRQSRAYGVPENSAERKKFYDRLENMTQDIIIKMRDLKTTNPARFTHCLCELAAAGSHCGSRYLNTVDYLSKLTSGLYDQTQGGGLQAVVSMQIDTYKIGIVDEWVASFQASEPTHIRNYAFKRLQKEGIALTGQDLLTEKDHFERVGLLAIAAKAKGVQPYEFFSTNIIQSAANYVTIRPTAALYIKNNLIPKFSATRLVDAVHSDLQHRANTDEDFRNKLIGELFEVLKKQNLVSDEITENLEKLDTDFLAAQKVSEDSSTAKADVKSHLNNILNKQKEALIAAGWYSPIVKIDGSTMHHFSLESCKMFLQDMKMIATKR